MANYPNSAPSFTNKSAGQTIASAHINSIQDEVTAIGAGLIQGTAQLNSSNSTVVMLTVGPSSNSRGLDVVNGSTDAGIRLRTTGSSGTVWAITTQLADGAFRIQHDVDADPRISMTPAGNIDLVATSNVTFTCAQVTIAGALFPGSVNVNSTSLVLTNAISSTAATAGAGASVPATVTGFLKVKINGTDRMIPFYNT